VRKQDSLASVDDPEAADVRELLERHLEFADEHSPPEDVHALDVSARLNLRARAGFSPCGPFGDYQPSRNSTFMTLVLGSGAGAVR
jgi:hypothetical protein